MQPLARTAVAVLGGLLALAPSAEAQSFTVTGRFEYADKLWNFDGWTGADAPRPIRRADVFVLQNLTGLVLGSGTTQQDGSFAITCLATGLPDIVVRCDADTDADGAFQRIRVTTESNLDYTVKSPVFFAHNPLFPLDVGTTTALPATSGGKEGQPFNLLDVAVSAFEFLEASGAAPATQTVRLTWPGFSGSQANGTQVSVGEDDGYDDAVVLHELGHVVHHIYSENDSSGGPHFFGDSDQDPRLAFSEGYATCFGGQVLAALGLQAIYLDCHGGAQTGGVQLRLDLETVEPWAAQAWGEADEVAVACTLWDLLDDESAADDSPGLDDDPFTAEVLVAGQSVAAAWWAVFSGPLRQALDLALHDAWDGWFDVHATDPHGAELQATFEQRRIRFHADAHEPDGSPAQAILTPPSDQWLTGQTLYSAPASAPAPGTGDADFRAVPLVAGDVIEIRTRYPEAAADAETEADTYLEILAPDGTLVAAADGGGVGRNALLARVPISASGTWHVKVSTLSSLRRYGRYDLRIRYLSQNHPPMLIARPSAFPKTLQGSATAVLDALASDPDGDPLLDYAWTPLDGGLIVGSGPSVTFVPPRVVLPTEARVQLVVTDSLGAQTEPAEVVLTLLPPLGGLCPAPAALTSLGSGKPGQYGTPTLAGLGIPLVPSYNFALQATGLSPQLPGFVVFGFTTLGVPFDGGTLWPAPELLLPVTPNAGGELNLPVFLPAEPQLCGLSVVTQVIVPHDPGAGGFKQTAQSNGLIVTFGD